MPLIQSPKKKALERNIRTEMEAHPGKAHRAQDLAIAYSVQRKNRKALGGVIGREMNEPAIERVGKELYLDEDERASEAESERDHKMHFAGGGNVDDDDIHKGQGGSLLSHRGAETGHEKGINKRWDPYLGKGGGSQAGGYAKAAAKRDANAPKRSVEGRVRSDYLNKAKDKHKQVLSEMRANKPNLPDNFAYGGESILDEEMPDEMDPRAGHEFAMNENEQKSEAERMRDKLMKMYEGGFASPEYKDAGRLGFSMMDQENDTDSYSKEGIINYALGGDVEERREMNESTDERAGHESYLDDLEMPIERHGMGEGMREEQFMRGEDNPSIADSVRRRFMAQGGFADDEDDAADDNAIEHGNVADRLNDDLYENEMYAEKSALKDVGRASNKNQGSIGYSDFGGDDSDQHDMVSSIRRKYMRDRMSA